MTLILLRKKFSQKLVKINLLKWIRRLIVTKLASKLFHPTDFVSGSKKDSANVSRKLSGAPEVCPNKLSRTESKLSENSAFVWIIQKNVSHSA